MKKFAIKLNDHNRWLTHGRPLNIQKLTEIGLIITDYGEDENLKIAIREFHNVMIENMMASGIEMQVLTKGLI